MPLAPSKWLFRWIKVLFPFPPTGIGNNQPYPLLLIKYELKLPLEVMPGLLVIPIQIQAMCVVWPFQLKQKNIIELKNGSKAKSVHY